MELPEEINGVLDRLAEAMPAVLGAIAIVIVGYLIALGLGELVRRVFERIGLERHFRPQDGKGHGTSGMRSPLIAGKMVTAFVTVMAIILAVRMLVANGALGDRFLPLADHLTRFVLGMLIIFVGAFFADLLSSFVARRFRTRAPQADDRRERQVKDQVFLGLIVTVVLMGLGVMLLTGTAVFFMLVAFLIVGTAMLLADAYFKNEAGP